MDHTDQIKKYTPVKDAIAYNDDSVSGSKYSTSSLNSSIDSNGYYYDKKINTYTDKEFISRQNPGVIVRYSKRALSVLGLVFIITLAVTLPATLHIWNKLSKFDSAALDTYIPILSTLIETGNPAIATAWRIPVKDDLNLKDIEEVMDFVAAEHNLKRVGESVLFNNKNKNAIESITGVPYRYSKTYMFCNAVTAAKMFNYSPAYSAYTPCRISFIEDKDGKRWLYSLNLNMIIYGGHPLPDDLKKATLKIRDGLLAIMQRASIGVEL